MVFASPPPTQHTAELRITPKVLFFFSFSLLLATVDFHSLNFSIQSHMAACVQINWFVVGRALLDIVNMQLLGGEFERVKESREVNVHFR